MMNTGDFRLAAAWFLLSAAAFGEGFATHSITLPDMDIKGDVLLDIGTGKLAPLPPAATKARTGQEFCPIARQAGDLVYDDARKVGLIVSSMTLNLAKHGAELGLTEAAPATLVVATETGSLPDIEAGDFVLLQDRRGQYVLLLVAAKVKRGLDVAWIVSPDPTKPFTREQIDALQKEAQRIASERQKREERPKPKVPVAKEDGRTPDEKLLAMARKPPGATRDELAEELQSLLAQGANVNTKTSGHATPLLLAASRANFELVRLLVSAGADVNASGALFPAAERGDSEMCKYLIEKGADVQRKSVTGETALQFALRATSRNDDVVRLLRERGATEGSLHVAAEAGDLGAIRHLAAAGNDINALSPEGLPPLLLAAKAGQIEACKLLLKLGASPAKKTGNGDTPLEYLLVSRKLDAVPLLIEHASPETLRGALLYAAAMHRPDLMRQVLARIPDPAKVLTEDAKNRLASALQVMSDAEVQILEQAGLQLPFWAAARFGRLERMKELIAAGVDVNQPPPFVGNTPLLRAVENGQAEAARLLLAAKADPSTAAEGGTMPTPLHEAVRNGDVEMARLLTSYKAAPNPLDSLGYPPLYYAVTAKRADLCRVLLDAGADPNMPVPSEARDRAGKRIKVPLWKLAKDPELIKLLKSHRGK